jgi:hypothetical protein
MSSLSKSSNVSSSCMGCPLCSASRMRSRFQHDTASAVFSFFIQCTISSKLWTIRVNDPGFSAAAFHPFHNVRYSLGLGKSLSFDMRTFFGLRRGVKLFGGGLTRKHCWWDLRWTRTGGRSSLRAHRSERDRCEGGEYIRNEALGWWSGYYYWGSMGPTSAAAVGSLDRTEGTASWNWG